MNANAIVKHHDYALTQYPSRGRSYYPGAVRVKVLHVYKVTAAFGRQKRMTLVECQQLDNEGNPKLDSQGNVTNIITVPARQIVAAWEEHVIERDRHESEKQQRDEERRLRNELAAQRYEVERAERLRLEDAARKVRQEEDALMLDALLAAGVPRDCIHINGSIVDIRIPRYRVKEVIESLEQSTKPTTSEESDATREVSESY